MSDHHLSGRGAIPESFMRPGHRSRASMTPNGRPKVLFLSWFFPPAIGAPCVRTWNVAKHLSRLGWDVTVVTPDPSIWRTIEDPEQVTVDLKREGIRRILTGHRWRCLVPDRLKCWNQGLGAFVGRVCRKIARDMGLNNGIGWIKAAEQACTTLTAHDVDVIFATGSPFSAFRLAKRLSDRIGQPYVFDYRDPWTGNPHAARPARTATIEEEARLLSGCSAVTIVSPSWGAALDLRFGVGPKLHVVTNGYDPEALTAVKPHAFGHFAIVYAGTFYPPKRVITPVMAALRCLQENHREASATWRFHYYGEQEDHVREEAKRFGVVERVVLHGRVPRTEVLSAVRGAGVAVVITTVSNNATPEDNGIVTSKVFEALGLGTAILLIAPPGNDAAEIVEGTRMGRRISGMEVQAIADFFLQIARTKREVGLCADEYSWPVLASELDKILRDVIAQKIS